MILPLLQTKLRPPALNSSYQPRPHLSTRLDADLAAKLTLITAPAGSGKTTLLTAWAAYTSVKVAWYALDEQDDDPITFWRAVTAALHQAAPEQIAMLPEGGAALNQAAQEAPHTLLNRLNAIETPIVLVLDDYHLVKHAAIQHSMGLFVDNLPPPHHIILSSRTMPEMPIARLRARRQLNELNFDDLRFDKQEAALFLKNHLPFSVSAELAHLLNQRVEGWAAGLQMAAIACRGKSRPHAFLQSFTGTHRHLADYFLTELFDNQTPQMQQFLLQTAILQPLHPDCCAAVTGFDDAPRFLRQIADDNLFLLPLDDERRWYRYHHLFAEWLQNRLQAGYSAESLAELHGRAADWYAAQGLQLEAIQHAFSAENISLAADLINDMILTHLWNAGRMHGLLDRLPEAEIEKRPALCLGIAWWSLEKKHYLDVAESLLTPEMPENEKIRGLISARRAILLRLEGDYYAAVTLAEAAIRHLPAELADERRIARQSLSVLYVTVGRFDDAYHLLHNMLLDGARRENKGVEFFCNYFLANIEIAYGRLPDAFERCETLIASGKIEKPMIGLLHASLGDVYMERNALKLAAHHFSLAREMGESSQSLDILNHVLPSQVMVFHYLGEGKQAKAAMKRLEEINEGYELDFLQRRLAWLLADFALKRDALDEVQAWVKRYDLSLSDRPDFTQIEAYLLLANYHLRRRKGGAPVKVLSLLNYLIGLGRGTNYTFFQIKVHLAKSHAYHADGRYEAARQAQQIARNMAEPCGFKRVLLDYALPDQPAPAALTTREQEILALIAHGHSNRVIAEHLSLTAGTVKWHLNNIYRKLDVRSRTQAISRARALRLLKP